MIRKHRLRQRGRTHPLGVVTGLAFLVWVGIASATRAQAGETTRLRYTLAPAGSVLRWELPATLHTVHGTASDWKGSVEAERLESGWMIRGRVVVMAEAMTTKNARRDRTMREKVLETGRFPEIVFETTHVEADLSRVKTGESLTAKVRGELTVHGKALPIELPVDVHIFPDYALITGSFPLSWKQYGLFDPSFGLVRVKEPMIIAFRLRAVPVN